MGLLVERVSHRVTAIAVAPGNYCLNTRHYYPLPLILDTEDLGDMSGLRTREIGDTGAEAFG
jgi:hypothetical protein